MLKDSAVNPDPTDTRDGRRIEFLSVGWTSLEALSGIVAGIVAGSIALIGFGADSVIEVASSLILLWRLSDHERGAQREGTALKLVGISFLLLAAFVAYESVESLVTRQAPRVSYFGMAFSALCLIVMPLLSRAKRRVAARLHSAVEFYLRLSRRDPAGRARTQCPVWLVVGRPAGRRSDGSHHRQGGFRGFARSDMRLPSMSCFSLLRK